MQDEDWQIPSQLQPDPTDYKFDLERALRSVVALRAGVPADAFTAGTLGIERTGSGVVIRDGLVLTIGYLITEAEEIWLSTADGRAVPGHALAVDAETGLGLVQALGRLNIPPLELQDIAEIGTGATAVLASAGGRAHAIETQVVAREPFAGYWEYMIEDALFTAPAHPLWSGGALISQAGKLLGIGSLILQQRDDKGHRLDTNMVVPAAHLRPVLDDLLTYGRVNRPARPWLGIYAVDNDDTVVVESLSKGGPAAQAGLRKGDQILAVAGEEITGLADLWSRVWACGGAGSAVPLRISRNRSAMEIRVVSADRASFLKAPRLH
jgi:S1-C subfamily serine protease